MAQQFRAEFTIAADHAALPGHFPDAPVVPAVVLLERIVATVESRIGNSIRIRGIATAKFGASLRPDECAQLFLSIGAGLVKFRLERSGTLVATGTLEIDCAMGDE
jgi:3-hydroxymyristoyl/3-hydroxydecanoyl-(acyl carrier protein) dehydratase